MKPSHTARAARILAGLLVFSAVALAGLFSPASHSAGAQTTAAAPRIDNVSPNPATRSGLVRISGANFGPRGAGQLTIDGRPSPYVAQWADDLIVAYVPEAAALGSVSVSVTTGGGAATTPLGVTTRAGEGRIRWRFTVAADHVPRRAAVGPDGTVYVNDVLGRLYALAPDGALKWVFQAGLVGAQGPVSVGADGTVYVAGLVPRNPSTPCQINSIVNVEGVFAVRPDGTQKWLFDKTCDDLLSGPNVGPDGKIHVVTDASGIGAFALNAEDGTLAHAPTGRFGVDGAQGTEIVFGPAAPGAAPTQKYFQYESGGLFGYTLDGQRVFLYETNAVGIAQPVAGQRTGNVYTSPTQIGVSRFIAVSPQGALRWQSPIHPIYVLSIPDAPLTESSVYVVQDISKLHRVSPADGSVVWTFVDNNESLFDPVASPDDRLVLMGGQANYNLPGFFEAVSQDGRQLWKQHLPDEAHFAPDGQVVPRYRARFTGDGRTAYIAAHVSGANRSSTTPPYSFFYALDTSDAAAPVNQPPRVTISSPAHNAEVAKGTRLDVRASVEDEGPISRVEFFSVVNGAQTPIGAATTPDADGLYSVEYTPTAPNAYGIVAVAYDAAGLSGTSASTTVVVTNEPPAVSWVGPADNASFAAPPSITLTARAGDADGQISIVHFQSNQIGEIGRDTTADAEGNYQIVWPNPPHGAHELAVWATDNDGARRAATINITIGPAPTPTPTSTPTPTPTPTPEPTPTPTPTPEPTPTPTPTPEPTPTPIPTYSISGAVRDAAGAPLAGVSVALSGDREAAATTDAGGNYSFADLPAGSGLVVTPSLANYTFEPPSQSISLFGNSTGVDFTAAAVPAVIRFGAASYSVSEADGRAAVVITRSGNTSVAASVVFQTVDDPASVPCDPSARRPDGTPYPQGTAYARCDYATTVETLTFAPGETEKRIAVPVIDDAHADGAEAVRLRLRDLSGASLGTRQEVVLTVADDDAAGRPNPVASVPFFVRQHYLDFLSREPEASEPWSAVLGDCADQNNTDAASPSSQCDRLLVSQSFFLSPEFQLKGLYSYLFYRVAFDRRPAYDEITPDMRSLAGATGEEVFARRAAYAAAVTERPEFARLYGGMTNRQYVEALLARHGLQQITTADPADFEGAAQVTLTGQQLADALDNNSLSRAQVLRAVVQSAEVGAAEYHGAFVSMQYYGYLRREPEQSGYEAWLRVIRQDPQNIRLMVNGFLNSTEYRLRFGQP